MVKIPFKIQLLSICILFASVLAEDDGAVAANSASSTPEQISAFISFLKQQDTSQSSKVTFRPHGSKKPGYVNEIQAVATQNIKEGEVIYTYPLQNAISLEKALSDPIIGETFKAVRGKDAAANSDVDPDRRILLFDDQIIRLYIIWLKYNPDKAPEWKAYFDALPSAENMQTPTFWKNEEREELKGSRLYRAINEFHATMRKEYSQIFPRISNAYPDFFDRDVFTLDEMKWAHTILNSRQWFRAQTVYSPVIPLVDVFNFREEPSIEFIESPTGDLQVVATEDIEQGEEIFMSDGKMSNRDLLEHFGFVLDKNPMNTLDVGLGLDRSDQLYGNKKKMLHANNLKDSQTYMITENEIPKELLLALRIYHVTVYDLDDANRAFEHEPISSQNELKVVETILDLCKNSLQGYPTTAKEDRELLKTANSKRLRDAIVFRRGEKVILTKTLEKATEMFKEVKKGWNLRSIDMPGTKDFRASIGGQEIL